MNVSPPIPWHLVPDGATVLIGGIPRVVLAVRGDTQGMTVFAEGLAPFRPDGEYTQLVLLDDADAAANLTAAGLTIEPIENGASS